AEDDIEGLLAPNDRKRAPASRQRAVLDRSRADSLGCAALEEEVSVDAPGQDPAGNLSGQLLSRPPMAFARAWLPLVHVRTPGRRLLPFLDIVAKGSALVLRVVLLVIEILR